MERCGFFDANLVGEEYDRVYLASQFAAYFASFIGNGVFAKHSNQLQVVEMATPQMQIGVERGQAWINGYWYENTDILYLPIDVADGVLNRIDSVVLRLGLSERNMWLAVKKGTPAINPIAPEVTRNADYYELQLATISIPAGSIKITQAQITDTRMNKDVCGLVTGVVDQIDTTSLFSQFMTAYQEWKDNQQADYEDWTDVQKAAYNKFISDTERDYTNYTTGKQEEFNTWYTTYLTAFQTAIEAWFENIKGQLSEDAAARTQLELDDHEALLNWLQHMLIQNDIFCPIELSDGSIFATNDDEAILMDWSYVEAPCTCSKGGAGLDATGVTSGYVPTADGNDGWSWQIQQGGGGVTVDNSLSMASENPVQNKVITAAVLSFQEAIVTSVSEESTDSEIPTAKAVYDLVGGIETLLAAI